MKDPIKISTAAKLLKKNRSVIYYFIKEKRLKTICIDGVLFVERGEVKKLR